MNTLLFCLDEQHVTMDGGYSFGIEPTDYSVIYYIEKIAGRRRVTVDFSSVKRQESREGRKYWVDARLDAPLLMGLEKQLQDEIDYRDETEAEELIEQYRRMRA